MLEHSDLLPYCDGFFVGSTAKTAAAEGLQCVMKEHYV
jgi:hypothetical protein